MTKPCDPPYAIDDSKSPHFSAADFNKLLSPHRPYLLAMDSVMSPVAHGFYPFLEIDPTPDGQDLVNHQFGYRFLPSFTNAIYALITRVLAVPQVKFPSVFEDSLPWYNIEACPSILGFLVLNDYIAHLKPHQKARILKAIEDAKFSLDFSSATGAFAKSDELLFKKKARIIWNVPAGFQAVLGPMVRQMTFFLKQTVADGKRIFQSTDFCDPNNAPDSPSNFTLCFACGMVAADLDDWFNYNLQLLQTNQIDWAGIFMGDDTYVLYRDFYGNIHSYECDYSAYDSTQRDAAQSFLRHVYQTWGVPEYALNLFKRMAEAPLKVQYGSNREFSFKIKLNSPQTATGKPDTCLGNTILNIHATIHHQVFGRSYEVFGFKAKEVRHSNPSFGTFLKGFWCRAVDGLYHWSPLPSAAMKMLKSMAPVPSLLKGLQMNLSSVGPVPTPLLRVLLQKYSPSSFTRQETDFKIFSEKTHDLLPLELESFLSYRYGPDAPDLFNELEGALLSADLGDRVFHPLWKILADVDYGDGRALAA